MPAWLTDFLTKIGVPAGLLALFALFGRSEDGDFIKDIWAAIKQASPPVAMITLWLYLRESAKRDSAEKQLLERTLEFIKSTNAAISTFDKALTRLTRGRR